MVNIERIKLVNFIGIYLGTGLTELEINRKNSANNIILILGENGSGKSSLINELTPLPLEHLGARNSSRILPDKVGTKELDLRVDGYILYKIKIVYTPNRSTKCYIVKEIDGKEIDLNPNGNVESYLDVLENELHMNKNYTNVGFLCGNGKNKNFVGMKPAERNNYISEWMPEIAEFLDAYKLSSKILTKLKRDIDNYNKQIGNMSSIDYEQQLNYINSSLEYANRDLKKIESQITELRAYNSQLEIYYRDLQKLINLKLEFKNFVNDINKRKREFNKKWEGVELPDTSNIEEFNNRLQSFRDSQKVLLSKLEKVEETLTILSEDISTSKTLLNNDARISNVDINMIYHNIEMNENLLVNINKSIEDFCEKYQLPLENLVISQEKLFKTKIIIETIDTKFIQLNNLVSFDVIRDMDHIDKSINDRTKRLHLVEKMLKKTQEELTFTNNEIYKYEHSNIDQNILMKRPEDCIRHCGVIEELLKYLNPQMHLHIIYDKSKELEKKKIEFQTEIDEIKETLKNYQDSMHIYVEITDFMYKNNDIIAILPDPLHNFFICEPSKVYTHINEIKSILEDLTELSSLYDKKNDIIKTNEDLMNIKNLVLTNNQISEKLKSSMIKYESLTNDKYAIEKDYEILSKQIDLYENASETIIEYNNEMSDINSDIEKGQKIKAYLLQLAHVNYIYASNNNYIDNNLLMAETKLKNEILQLNSKRDEMTTFYVSKRQIEKMRNELQTEFNKINILNKIWSPKVGYPSLKIDSFLNNLTIKTNSDLNNMWGQKNLKIKEFKIGSSEFDIIVVKDGIKIDDASLCSESETQIINTAISFSIVESNIENNGYDVLRLDELDMSLDAERRRGFMEMIQERIEQMGVNSCFIISHNNQFDDIPADVILMSDYKLEEIQMKDKNIIFRV